MTVNYNFSKGSDFPLWQWLPFFPGGTVYYGFDADYDGVRYIYMIGQVGSSSTSASTTQLWRYDTWGQAWQLLASPTSGNRGMTLTYDRTRNVLIMVHGAALTSWQIFNLNVTSVSICGVACASWTLTTMTPVLPAAADYGATIVTVGPNSTPATIESGILATGTTTTTMIDTSQSSAFCDLMVGLEFKITSGTYSGQKRFITSVTDGNTLVVGSAFGGTPSVADSYTICLPEGTTSSATTSTLVDSTATWTVNQYTNADVLIVSGTGSGQKRRIASNTATTLTLAAAVTGNVNTGNWTVTPDATSVYKIQPSSDFLYYSPGSTSATFYKIDLATGASAPAWVTLTAPPAVTSGGANVMWPDAIGSFNLLVMRGNGTSTFYSYNIGLNSWTTLVIRAGSETFTTGASSTVWDGQRKIIIHKDSSTRLYVYNMATRELEPLATLPYAAPGGYDHHSLRLVTNSDGTQWLYFQRPGGAEFFRMPLEWGLLS